MLKLIMDGKHLAKDSFSANDVDVVQMFELHCRKINVCLLVYSSSVTAHCLRSNDLQ